MDDIELEPNVVANLLKNINTQAPQHLESPEPLDDEVSTPNLPSQRRDSDLGQSASLPRQRHRPNVSTMEERLMMMPEKRPLPWRDGVEPGSENETGGESRRKQIRFGCLLATRGDIQEVPCQSCANGRGKFRVCVALEGYFKGACASCQLSGRPNRCSIKRGDSKSFHPRCYTSYSNSSRRCRSSYTARRRSTHSQPATGRTTNQETTNKSSTPQRAATMGAGYRRFSRKTKHERSGAETLVNGQLSTKNIFTASADTERHLWS